MFWLDNFNELFKPILYPNINMSLDEKINAVVRLILFIGIITTLVFNDSRYILFVFIIMIISIIIYNYQSEKNSKFEKFFSMETASFNGLLKTIFYLFAIYYAIKFLTRLFLPVLAKKVVEKASEQFNQQYQQQNKTQQTAQEKPKAKKIVGEYVDFEEIE